MVPKIWLGDRQLSAAHSEKNRTGRFGAGLGWRRTSRKYVFGSGKRRRGRAPPLIRCGHRARPGLPIGAASPPRWPPPSSRRGHSGGSPTRGAPRCGWPPELAGATAPPLPHAGRRYGRTHGSTPPVGRGPGKGERPQAPRHGARELDGGIRRWRRGYGAPFHEPLALGGRGEQEESLHKFNWKMEHRIARSDPRTRGYDFGQHGRN